MRRFEYSVTVPAEAQSLFRTILNVRDFPSYIIGIREVSESGPFDNGEIEVTAVVSLRYFSGKATARVLPDENNKTLRVDFTRGPFKVARATISIAETADEESELRYNVEYATPVAIYLSLVDRHKHFAIERISNLFANRSRTFREA